MTRLIGGLLVVSLLYGPAIFSVKYFAYNPIKDNGRIVFPITKSDDVPYEINTQDIYYAFDELDAGEQRITALIKEKNILCSKIESELDLRSYLKVSLDEEQINGFAQFMECYNRESSNIQRSLEKIDESKSHERVKTEILHNSEYTELALSELTKVNKYQNEAIDSIMRIIDSGNNMLKML